MVEAVEQHVLVVNTIRRTFATHGHIIIDSSIREGEELRYEFTFNNEWRKHDNGRFFNLPSLLFLKANFAEYEEAK